MRAFLLVASAIVAFGATMTFESTDASAFVCARGVYGAAAPGRGVRRWCAAPWWPADGSS